MTTLTIRSAIRSTLAAIRQTYPDRRIMVVFEPHQIIRTESLADEFAAALADVDDVLTLPVLPAREKAGRKQCCNVSGMLVRRTNQAGGRAFLLANLDQVISRIDHSGRPGDVIVTMGAGKANQIHDQLTRRIQRYSAA